MSLIWTQFYEGSVSVYLYVYINKKKDKVAIIRRKDHQIIENWFFCFPECFPNF